MFISIAMSFTIDDMDSYGKNRGFNFDNPFNYMPGMHIKNVEELRSFIENLVDGVDNYSGERKSVNDFFNECQDGHSSQRVLDTIGISRI